MKNNIISFLAGAVILATAFLGYTFYNETRTINAIAGVVSQHDQTLNQVVTWINNQGAPVATTTKK